MKKLTIILALVAFCFAASAQQMHLQSAISYMNKKYLNKAKEEVDLAVSSDKNVDAKTWFWKAKIYISMGQYPTNPNGYKWKGDIPEDWRDQAYNACLECKRLDESKEYSEQNNQLLNILGIECSNASIDLYNNGNYAEAMQKAEVAIKMYNESGNAKSSNDSYYICGLSAVALHDTAAIIKNFNTLIRKKTDKNAVYQTMFNIYKAQGKNEDAFKTATSYQKNCPKDYKAYTLVADAYLMNQNLDKAKESLAAAEDLTKDNPQVYSQLLCAEGGILAGAGEFQQAEAKYQESLGISATQFEANYGMGIMIYNRGVDKIQAANEVVPNDEADFALIDNLTNEAKGFFAQTEPYMKAALTYIDGLNEDAKKMQRGNLHNCLIALKNVYARLERYDEMKPIAARIEQIEKGQ